MKLDELRTYRFKPAIFTWNKHNKRITADASDMAWAPGDYPKNFAIRGKEYTTLFHWYMNEVDTFGHGRSFCYAAIKVFDNGKLDVHKEKHWATPVDERPDPKAMPLAEWPENCKNMVVKVFND